MTLCTIIFIYIIIKNWKSIKFKFQFFLSKVYGLTKGCFRASSGVNLLFGSKAKHFSNKSLNYYISLITSGSV